MPDYKTFLLKLNENLLILQEREAKYGGNAPLDLLNQIDDHKQAIVLTERAIAGEIAEADWQEALKPLNLSLTRTTIFQTVIQSVPMPLIIGVGIVLLGVCMISVIILGLGITNVEPVRMALFPTE
ncbi:hypothetical protein ACFLXQ_07000, partial [Chloroflexota bacterium]